jgi:hypothetical protein
VADDDKSKAQRGEQPASQAVKGSGGGSGGSGNGEQEAPPRDPSTLTYSRDRLVAESEALLGVQAHTTAGALALADEDQQDFKLDEVEPLVQEWLERPVTAE